MSREAERKSMALVNVIKWEASSKELIHKAEIEDIKLGSQLVVYPSQTAFFVRGGQLYDEFICGTYSIKSDNIPLLNHVINLPFGGDSPFQAEVWFINQISILDCKWGTPAPIQIEDPLYKVIVPIRSFGQYGFRISNPRLFLELLIGNVPTFATDSIVNYFRGVLLSKLTAIITQKLYADELSIINISTHVDEISEYAKGKLAEVFTEYGIKLEMFSIISITVNEEDPSFIKLKEAKDALAKINILGRDNYQMERSFKVLESAAENECGLMGAAVGIGAGVGIGATVAQIAKEKINTNPPAEPPVLSDTRYFLGANGIQLGSFTYDEVCAKFRNHEIDRNTLVWTNGMDTWAKITDVEAFAPLVANCPPPLPPL